MEEAKSALDPDEINQRIADDVSESMVEAGRSYRLRFDWAPERSSFPDTAAGEAAYLLACRLQIRTRLKAAAGEAVALLTPIDGPEFSSPAAVGMDSKTDHPAMDAVSDARSAVDAVEANIRREASALTALKRTIRRNDLSRGEVEEAFYATEYAVSEVVMDDLDALVGGR